MTAGDLEQPAALIDVSLPLSSALVTWPGDPGLSLTRDRTFKADGVNVSSLQCGVHTGTHVDAPLHFVDDGVAIDRLNLETLVGPAVVVHLEATGAIGVADLEHLNREPVPERILFRTSNSEWWADPGHAFHEDFVALSVEAAAWLVARGVRLVGVDYLSVEPYRQPDAPTHKILLEAGVVIVEGLDLRGVEPGAYELLCLPLKLVGSDGAPARAVLRRL